MIRNSGKALSYLNQVLKCASKSHFSLTKQSTALCNSNFRLYACQNKKFFGSKGKEGETENTDKTAAKEENTKEEQETPKKNEEQTVPFKKYNELKALYDDSEANLEKARYKFDELRKAYNESIADIDRIRKRSETEVASAKEFSITKFAKDTLEVYDNFDRALSSLKSLDNTEITAEEKLKIYSDFTEGIVMTKATLIKVLGLHGIKEYNPLKEKFDPNKHEAVFQSVSTEIPAGSISDVMQTGFTIGTRILRPAKVGVVKKH